MYLVLLPILSLRNTEGLVRLLNFTCVCHEEKCMRRVRENEDRVREGR